jgi:hypothetical protein
VRYGGPWIGQDQGVTDRIRLITSPGAAGLAVIVVASLTAASASVFQLEGHETIEAAAYKRLLSAPHVPTLAARASQARSSISRRGSG